KCRSNHARSAAAAATTRRQPKPMTTMSANEMPRQLQGRRFIILMAAGAKAAPLEDVEDVELLAAPKWPLWLKVPRWPVAPTDFILIVELVLFSFFSAVWRGVALSSPWRDYIKTAEQLVSRTIATVSRRTSMLAR